MSTQARKTSDVIIIGGGPAGLSAALWCSELGLKATLLEKEKECGGQLSLIHNPITNYLGIEATDGRQLRDRFFETSAHAKFERVCGAEVVSVDLQEKVVKLGAGKKFAAHAVIIATGVRRRNLSIPGEEEFRGRGILTSGVGERDKVAGKRVVIVGGGDAAIENAVLLSETAEKVFVVHRRKEFSARPEFLEQALDENKIDIITPGSLTAIHGDALLESVSIRDHRTRQEVILPTDLLLIRIGVQANTEVFAGQIILDSEGYVIVDSFGETSIKNVFAVGDVSNPEAPTIAGAVGSGATVAKVIKAISQEDG